MDYYVLPRVTELHHEDIQNARSKELLRAIDKNSNIELIESHAGRSGTEYLTIDVKSPGIRSENRAGIEYRERLALRVETNLSRVPGVIPLRLDFPELMHTNEAVPGLPRELCLYSDASSAILRSWTPEKFLQRIIWWLESSSEDSLHFADQPLEQPFFASHHNVVLPSDIQKHIAANNLEELYISSIVQRPSRFDTENELTFVTEFSGSQRRYYGESSVNVDVKTHLVSLPPQVHGTINRLPSTFAGLYTFLKSKSLAECNRLQDFLIESGVEEETGNTKKAFTLFLIFTPNKRREDSIEAEKIHVDAILSHQSPGAIAKSFGLLEDSISDTSTRRFQRLLFAEIDLNSEKVNKNELLNVEVIKNNCHEMNRAQSGLTKEGPKGAVVGVGSLGSALVELWTRCSWGKWKILDCDYVRPHNLVRHTAQINHIGKLKVDAVYEMSYFSSTDEPTLEAVNCNVVEADEDILLGIYKDLDFIIDASTTLEYPRRISIIDDAPRHCSTFLTPSGEASVLLLEDANRSLRLISIEAQYYRALINENWGSDLLGRTTKSYYSGASCRDISTQLAYSTVLTHTANIAEQIQTISDNASARVWKRNNENGAIFVHEIPLMESFSTKVGFLTISYDQGLIDKMQMMRSKQLPCESGGILVGYHDFNINHIFIVDARPAPEDSESSISAFQRGLKGVAEDLDHIRKSTNGHVDYIGEWHSHPEGCSSLPSQLDLIQLADLANTLAADGLPAVSMIISKQFDSTDDIQLIVGKHE